MIPSPRPLVLALLCILAGLLPALRFGFTPLLAIAFALLALLSSFVFRKRRKVGAVLLFGSFAAAGAALGAISAQDVASDCRSALADGRSLAVAGVLEASAHPLSEGELPPLLPVVTEPFLAGDEVCGGRIRVSLPDGTGAVPAGSWVLLSGEWRASAPPVVPSPWPDDPLYSGFMVARSATITAEPALLRNPLLTMRGRAESRLYRLFPRHAALADALLLGRRESLDPEMREKFARSGLVHLLAISGAHVALLAGVLVLLGAIVRLPHKAVAIGTIALVWAYLAMIGAPASAVRSGIMITLALLGLLLQRPAAAIPIIAASALVILAFQPTAALDPGFQLSFAGVLGILVVRHSAIRRLPLNVRRNKPLNALIEAVLMSVGAFLATMPVAAFHFGSVAPIAILANLPAVPLTSLALVGVAAATVVDLIAPPVAGLLADGAGAALDAMDRVASFAATVPYGSIPISRPNGWAWLFAAAALLLALDFAGRLRPRIRRAVAAGVALSVLLVWPPLVRAAADPLELWFLDVGQGDAIAVRTPASRWILFDTGPKDEWSDAGERRVLPFLRARGVHRIEIMILTHPHADHIGGAAAVLRGLEVGRIVEPGLVVGNQPYLDLLAVAEAKMIPWHAARSGRTITLDGVRLDFLWPDEETLDGTLDANQISAVVRLSYGGFAALLTGDAPAEVEHLLIKRHGGKLRAQVLKAGHHGSRTATSGEFLETVGPAIVIISAGRRNRYGHPAPEVIERVRAAGIPILRTDRDGTIGIRVRGPDADWERIVP